MSTRTFLFRSIGWWLAGLLLLVWFTAGIGYLGLRYYVWPQLDFWRPLIVDRVSRQIGRPVSIGRLQTSLRGWRPALTIDAVEVLDPDGRASLQAATAQVTFSLPKLLLGQASIDTVTLIAPNLTAEYFGAGQWRVAGFDSNVTQTPDDRAGAALHALQALLALPQLKIVDGRFAVFNRVDDSHLAVAGLNLQLRNDDRHHQIALMLPDPGDPADGLKMSAQLDSPPSGDLIAWREWRGEWFIGTRHLTQKTLTVLSRLVFPSRQDTELPWRFDDAELMAWGRWQTGQTADVLVKLAARQPRWQVESTGSAAGLSALRAQWRMTLADDGPYRIDIERLQLELPDGNTVAAGDDSWLLLSRAGRPSKARLALQPFDLVPVSNWVRAQRWSAKMAPQLEVKVDSGRIARASVEWLADGNVASSAALPSASWIAQVDFERLSIGPQRIVARYTADGRPLPSIPSVERASGQLVIDERGGRLQFGAGQGAAWSFPGLFEAPKVPLDQWSARLAWQRTGSNALRVVLEEAQFANADATLFAAGELRIDGQSKVIDLSGRLPRARAVSVARYLPLSIPHQVREWVGRSVKAGESDDVKFVVRGDLHKFPYDKERGAGEFRVDVRLRHGELAFAPNWPALRQVTGRLSFERASMQAVIDNGMLQGVSVRGTRLAIPDMHHGVLTLDAKTRAPAARMIGLVNASPLDHSVNHALRQASATGDVDLNLSARIPLNSHDPNAFEAALTLHDNDFLLAPGKPALTGLRGTLVVGHDGVTARDLTAKLLGGPLRVDASAPQPGHVLLRARGALSLQSLRTVADSPLTRSLDGSADYEAEVDISARGVKFSLSSALTDMASELPPPFAKKQGTPMPLRVVSSPAPVAADGFITSISIGDSVRMQIARRFDPKAGRALIDRAAFAMNTEPQLPDSGLAVALNLPRVDFDAWAAAMGSAAIGQPGQSLGAEFAPTFSLLPRQVSVLSRELIVGGKSLHDVVFRATRESGAWQANVKAREVDGYFSWRDAPSGQPLGKLTARFARLEIPSPRRQESKSFIKSDRTDLPELDVVVEALVLNNRPLGRLRLLAENGSEAGHPAWKLHQLRIEHPAATLNASGIWSQHAVRADQGRPAGLDFKLDLRDAGALLNDFGIPDAIRAGPGTIHGKVDWAGSPLAIDYPSLHGKIRIDLGKGQFLKTDPGLAKLIGVLNLQSLPRRLSLDFRDIFSEGFAFDEIAGDVGIDGGVARTDALRMNGMQAQVHLRGDADLAGETQALDIEVRPNLNAGLASLAYAAVNPVVGLGSFVAQFVLRKPLEAAFTYRYQVSGSWIDPVVVEQFRAIEPNPVLQP